MKYGVIQLNMLVWGEIVDDLFGLWTITSVISLGFYVFEPFLNKGLWKHSSIALVPVHYIMPLNQFSISHKWQ